MATQTLQEHFQFNETDLQANRNGTFSAKQKDRLFGRHLSAVRQKRIAAAITLPVSILMLAWMGYLTYQSITSQNSSAIGAIIPLGFFGALLLLAGSYILRISFIGPTYLVKKVAGPINIIKNSKVINNITYTNYELHVGGETLNLHLDSQIGDILKQGDTYAIYYSQGVENGLREILSAELLTTTK